MEETAPASSFFRSFLNCSIFFASVAFVRINNNNHHHHGHNHNHKHDHAASLSNCHPAACCDIDPGMSARTSPLHVSCKLCVLIFSCP